MVFIQEILLDTIMIIKSSYVFLYQMMKSDQEMQQLKYGKELNKIKHKIKKKL